MFEFEIGILRSYEIIYLILLEKDYYIKLKHLSSSSNKYCRNTELISSSIRLDT